MIELDRAGYYTDVLLTFASIACATLVATYPFPPELPGDPVFRAIVCMFWLMFGYLGLKIAIRDYLELHGLDPVAVEFRFDDVFIEDDARHDE